MRISEWAAKHGRLPDGSRYTPWPYQVGILDEFNNPSTKKITFMKAARTGYTQMITTYVGYLIVNNPVHIIFVQPTIDDAKEYSKDAIDPILDWPVMKMLSFARSISGKAGDTIAVKRFPGGDLRLIGANSPRGFRRIDGDSIIFDETDGYPVTAGAEGDQLSLGAKRLEQSYDPKDIAGSTPTEEATSKIYPRFQESDQRYYHVPCPHCGAKQKLVWGDGDKTKPGLRWEPFEAPDRIWYQCVKGCEISEAHKVRMLKGGEWIADKPENYERTGHAGFHVSALYSLQPQASWRDLANEFLAKRKSPLTLKTFINVTLGEVWKFKGEAPEWERLYNRREDRPAGIVPYGGCFLTAAVDIQAANGGRLEVFVWAWGRGGSSWLIEHKVIPGSPFEQKVWNELTTFCLGKWQHENGTMLGIERIAVDCGYATLPAYRWCKRQGVGFAMPIRGSKDLTAPAIAPSKAMELSSSKGSKKSEVRVHMVGGHILKQELYALLSLDRPMDGQPYPLGYVNIPAFVDDEFCKQIVSEEWIEDKGEWRKTRANEALDGWCYSRAVAIARGADKWTEAEWATLEARFAHPEHEVEAPPEAETPVKQVPSKKPEPERHEPEPEPEEDRQWSSARRGSWLRR